jgi:ribosomal protein S9
MATKSKVIEKKSTEPSKPEGRYHYAVGRRKTAIAQIRLYEVEDGKPVAHIVNGKPISTYFRFPDSRSPSRRSRSRVSKGSS